MAPKDDFDLTPAERERIRTIELFIASEPEDGRRIRFTSPLGWIPVALMVLLAGGLIWASQHFGWKRNQGTWPVIFLPLMSLLGMSAIVLGLRGNRRGRWRAMRAAGYPICIGCGYRLDRRAEGSDHCPECGKTDAEQVVKGWPPHPARESHEQPDETA